MQLVVNQPRYIEVKKSVRDRLARAEKECLCVACLEPLDGRVVRGCHERCHKATMRAIDAGLTTEIERVSEGKLLEMGKRGRKPTNLVSKELSK